MWVASLITSSMASENERRSPPSNVSSDSLYSKVGTESDASTVSVSMHLLPTPPAFMRFNASLLLVIRILTMPLRENLLPELTKADILVSLPLAPTSILAVC